jgi:hypothetical protein
LKVIIDVLPISLSPPFFAAMPLSVPYPLAFFQGEKEVPHGGRRAYKRNSDRWPKARKKAGAVYSFFLAFFKRKVFEFYRLWNFEGAGLKSKHMRLAHSRL